MLRLLAGALIGLAATGCDSPGDALSGEPGDSTGSEPVADSTDTGQPDDPAPTLESLDCQNLEYLLVSSELTRADLRRAFGAPEQQQVTTEPNRHIPEATDSIFELAWEGLEIRIRTPPDGDDLAERALVSDARFLRYPSLGPGANSDDLVSVLGSPSRSGSEALVWDCGMGASQPVTFHLEEGVVRRIQIDFYVD